MTRKLVMFDIDGTLLDHDKKLPASAKEAVQSLKEAGHEVVIATGRAPYFIQEIREELGIDSYICFNGQYVVKDNEVIYRNPIEKDFLIDLANIAMPHEHPLVFMGEELMKSTIDFHSEIAESLATLQANIGPIEMNANYYNDTEIYQALLYCKVHEEALYREKFPNLHFIRWHEYAVDVLPLGGSKANGIAVFIEKTDFTKEQVYAFGDGLNDIEMLQYVGHGVAMGNAPDAVKKAARYVTKDVSEDGLAHGLEMVGLL
ncbi:Cof-type HAD-IIB family hydrolase [Sporosarcina sp. NPDC096371]|uniref:Cof-type HAD-IIB family hydrolase n=1 Tax=Sporosarcina sp. NPDC096371 TaxID=3364530 RepID=UPI003803D7C2